VMRAILSLSFLDILYPPLLPSCNELPMPRCILHQHSVLQELRTIIAVGGTELIYLAAGDEAMFPGHCPANSWMLMRPVGRINFRSIAQLDLLACPPALLLLR
jgi:hypothetical protein